MLVESSVRRAGEIQRLDDETGQPRRARHVPLSVCILGLWPSRDSRVEERGTTASVARKISGFVPSSGSAKKKQRVPRVGDKIVIRSSRHVIRRILPIMPATSRDACSIKAPSARGVRPVRLSRHTSILASGTDRESPKNSFEKLFVASSNFRTVDPLIVTPIIFMIPVGRTGRRG